jgi:soluble lytic murein transglycosylase-like protein
MKKKIFLFLLLITVIILNPISCRIMTLVTANIMKIQPKFFYKLIKKESSFNTFAISAQGAIGLGQLMPITINSFFPNKYKILAFFPPTNLYMSAKYTKILLKKYKNNWSLTLAAYNWGEGNVNKRLPNKIYRNQNYTEQFCDIPETYNYLISILK